MAKETFIQHRKRPISDTCYEHARIIHGSNDFHLLFVARSVTCPPRPIKRVPLVPAAINRHQPSFRIDERCTRVRACVRALIASLSLSRVHTSLSHSAILFSSAVAFMNDFSLFSHRCLDPQLIIRDLPSAQRDWPLATSWTVMANSRLRNHARHTTPVPKYFLRKSVRLPVTYRTSLERLFFFRFDRFFPTVSIANFFDSFSCTLSKLDSYIYIYVYAWYREIDRLGRILYYIPFKRFW